MTVQEAVEQAERILPGVQAPDDEQDPRWQAIIRVGDFLETHPEEVWDFVRRWGKHANADLRMAVSTCLLEHLLEHHFESLFPRVQREARKSKRFADTLLLCWRFRQSKEAANAARLDQLERELRPANKSLQRARPIRPRPLSFIVMRRVRVEREQ